MINKTSVNDNERYHEQHKNSQQFAKVDYDQLLSSAGEFGKFQIQLFFLTVPFYVIGAFTYFTQMFLTQVSPNHWCMIPELINLTVAERKSLAIPSDAKAIYGYDRCRSYVANWSEVLISGLDKPDTTWETQVCQNGWEFNNSEIPYSTIGREAEWVCDKNSYQATAQSMFFVGSIVGGFLIGWLADRHGRIPAIVIANMIGCFGGVISIFAYDLVTFSICRFIVGISYDNCMIMMYLLTLECVAPKYRTMMGNLPFSIFFTMGCVILPWITLACNNWKILSLATSIPMLITLLTPWCVLESPRWLLYQGRVEETIEKIKLIASTNKTVIPETTITDFKKTVEIENTEIETESIIDILKSPPLRRAFICLCLLYMCCMAVFDGLVRSTGQLKFDFFLSFTIVSITEFPSIFILGFILDITGRKCLSVVTLVICAVFSFAISFIGGGWESIICATIARFCINMSCNISFQWGAEILPTPVRGSGVAIIHVCGYIATVISPFIAYLSNTSLWLPLVLVGIIAIAGALFSLSLPETTNKEMPQTFLDSEDLIKKANIIELPFLNKPKKVTVTSGHLNESLDL